MCRFSALSATESTPKRCEKSPTIASHEPLRSVSSITRIRGTQPDDDPPTTREGTVATLGAMEEIMSGIERRVVICRRVLDIGPGARLAGYDLTGAQLAGIDLSGANLKGAKLGSADLRGANLTNADLSGAVLVFAQLRDAIVTGADFSWANLKGANLVGVDRSTANFTGCDMLHATTEGDVDFYAYLKAFNPTWEPPKK